MNPEESKTEEEVSITPTTKKKQSFFAELVQLALIAVLVVIPFRVFVAQPFVVNGASMDPTFKNGDYLIVDQVKFKLNSPERGEVLIFKYPRDTKKYFIKRIIGLPGETIEIKNGEVTIINEESPEGFALTEPYIVFKKNDNFSVKLNADEFFVLGDNRLGSADSRLWGPLPEKLIVGRPLIRLFPINKISVFPGDKSPILNNK